MTSRWCPRGRRRTVSDAASPSGRRRSTGRGPVPPVAAPTRSTTFALSGSTASALSYHPWEPEDVVRSAGRVSTRWIPRPSTARPRAAPHYRSAAVCERGRRGSTVGGDPDRPPSLRVAGESVVTSFHVGHRRRERASGHVPPAAPEDGRGRGRVRGSRTSVGVAPGREALSASTRAAVGRAWTRPVRRTRSRAGEKDDARSPRVDRESVDPRRRPRRRETARCRHRPRTQDSDAGDEVDRVSGLARPEVEDEGFEGAQPPRRRRGRRARPSAPARSRRRRSTSTRRLPRLPRRRVRVAGCGSTRDQPARTVHRPEKAETSPTSRVERAPCGLRVRSVGTRRRPRGPGPASARGEDAVDSFAARR